MTYIVGLCGPNKVGKTSTTRSIERRAVGVHVDAFANPIYDGLSAMLGVSVEWLKYWKDDPISASEAPIQCLIGKKIRDFLKPLGSEFGRSVIGQDVWVQLGLARARQSGADIYIFDDVRLPNEAAICDLVIECAREGVSYTEDHSSAYRLPLDIIDVTWHLTPGRPDLDAPKMLDFILKRRARHAAQA